MEDIASATISFLSVYRDPMVAANTGKSDWTVNDLINGDGPATAYLIVRPVDASRLRPVIKLILTQIIRRSTGGVRGHAHRLLLSLEGFSDLKRLPALEDAMGHMDGHGVKCLLTSLDSTQLEAAYGEGSPLMDNCPVKVFFAPNDIRTAKVARRFLGESLGTVDDVMGLRRCDVKRTWPANVHPNSPPLCDVTDPGEVLIVTSGKPPIRGRQGFHFMVDELADRRATVNSLRSAA